MEETEQKTCNLLPITSRDRQTTKCLSDFGSIYHRLEHLLLIGLLFVLTHAILPAGSWATTRCSWRAPASSVANGPVGCWVWSPTKRTRIRTAGVAVLTTPASRCTNSADPALQPGRAASATSHPVFVREFVKPRKRKWRKMRLWRKPSTSRILGPCVWTRCPRSKGTPRTGEHRASLR